MEAKWERERERNFFPSARAWKSLQGSLDWSCKKRKKILVYLCPNCILTDVLFLLGPTIQDQQLFCVVVVVPLFSPLLPRLLLLPRIGNDFGKQKKKRKKRVKEKGTALLPWLDSEWRWVTWPPSQRSSNQSILAVFSWGGRKIIPVLFPPSSLISSKTTL